MSHLLKDGASDGRSLRTQGGAERKMNITLPAHPAPAPTPDASEPKQTEQSSGAVVGVQGARAGRVSSAGREVVEETGATIGSC